MTKWWRELVGQGGSDGGLLLWSVFWFWKEKGYNSNPQCPLWAPLSLISPGKSKTTQSTNDHKGEGLECTKINPFEPSFPWLEFSVVSFVRRLLCTTNTVQRPFWCRVFASYIDIQPYTFGKTFTHICGKATELDVQNPVGGVVELLLQGTTGDHLILVPSSELWP